MIKGAILQRRVGTIYAVDGIDLDIREGETLGLVGESGCGKTTTIMEILSLARPASGSIAVLGRDTAGMTRPRPLPNTRARSAWFFRIRWPRSIHGCPFPTFWLSRW